MDEIELDFSSGSITFARKTSVHVDGFITFARKTKRITMLKTKQENLKKKLRQKYLKLLRCHGK